MVRITQVSNGDVILPFNMVIEFRWRVQKKAEETKGSHLLNLIERLAVGIFHLGSNYPPTIVQLAPVR